MGKKYWKPKRPNFEAGMSWNQTQIMNQMTYQYHFDNLYAIALNRVRWVNLPEGCNSRFLEETLLLQGQAVIFKDKGIFGDKDLFFTTQVTSHGPWNLYNNPTKLVSIGNNGWHVRVPWQKGVMVWDTQDRLYNTCNYIQLFAARLMEADRVADVNLQTMKRPFVIVGPEEKQQEMVRIYQNIDSNEPAIFGLPGLTDTNIQVLQTGATYLGEEMQYRKQLLMNEFMSFLGIDNPGIEKQERMTQQEVERLQSVARFKRMNYLTPRRDALEVLKKRFPDEFRNTEVIWNNDNVTPTYNVMHNLEKALDLDYQGRRGEHELEDGHESVGGIGYGVGNGESVE